MANVYILNLKDNRTNHDKNDDTKFSTCMRNGIISIGWGSEESRESSAYRTAINKFNEMKKGDLVWTKNPKNTDKIYLLEIADNEVRDALKSQKDCFVDDIVVSKKISENIISFPPEKLPEGITKNDIVSGHTVERVQRQFLIDATLDCVKRIKGE